MSLKSSYWYTGNELLTNYYYYFYNWNVKEICSSPFAEVEAKIGSNEDLTISVDDCPYDSIILSAIRVILLHMNGIINQHNHHLTIYKLVNIV